MALPSARAWSNALVAGALLGAASLLLAPGWIPEWLGAVRSAGHFRVLVARPVSLLLLAALARWRRPDARVLLAVGMVPITPAPYETVALGLVPRSPREMGVLIVGPAAASLAQLVVKRAAPVHRADYAADVLILLTWVPAVAMVLRRPNAGPAPAWLDRVVARARLPHWLWGEPAQPASTAGA